LYFVLKLIITILIGFGCPADRFSNTGTAASREPSAVIAVRHIQQHLKIKK
jgi:hypothetical protein